MAEQEQSLRTLSEVLRERHQELGISYRALEERCVFPPDVALKRSTLERLEKDAPNLTPPKLPELQALAAGYDLPLPLLQDAAGYQFHGVTTQWSASGKARAFVARFDQLDPADQDRVLAMLEAFASAKPKTQK
ncbi:hypothetical protein ACFY7C_12205 [Streptomyces sp. NPDC012769]|uniref:hypothetical protein n=1 Tax=Streptomyces sp. NPDC012769 TaxID=3364848 RepID=UPI003696FBA3